MVDRTQHCTGCKERQDRIAELEGGMRKAHHLIEMAEYAGSVDLINQHRWLETWFDDQGELK